MTSQLLKQSTLSAHAAILKTARKRPSARSGAEPFRPQLVRRARARLASGFYDSDACLCAALERMLGAVLATRQDAGRSAGRADRRRAGSSPAPRRT